MLQHLLEVYGYPLLFLGTFLEGETPLLAASFLAHRGYFSLPTVMTVAFCAAFSSDQICFYLGRTRGRALLARRASWQPKVEHAQQLLDRWGTPLVVLFRFLYGLRIVTPFVVGTTGFGRLRFLLLNAIGGVLWAVTIGVAGYSVGELLSLYLVDMKRYEVFVLLAIVLVSLVIWTANRIRSRRDR